MRKVIQQQCFLVAIFLFNAVSLHAQKIIKVTPNYVLIDTDIAIVEINDTALIQRKVDGKIIDIGAVKLLKFGNRKVVAKIIQEFKTYRIEIGDLIRNKAQNKDKILASPELSSQSKPSNSVKKFGIGFQAAPFPIFGLSSIFNLNDNLGLQGIAQAGINVDFIAMRALYRFTKTNRYNVYAGGLVGFFRDDDVTEYIFSPEQTDEAIGYGVGGGFEYFFKGLSRVGWNIEVDYIYIDFEKKWWQYDYKAFSLIMLGFGIQYYF